MLVHETNLFNLDIVVVIRPLHYDTHILDYIGGQPHHGQFIPLFYFFYFYILSCNDMSYTSVDVYMLMPL